MTERWLPVVGWEGWYEVSDLGQVRSIRFNKIMNGRDGGEGYLRVTLVADGRSTSKKVHRLVACAFLGPLPPGFQTNHKDGDKKNNRLDNLEFVTRSANMLHAYEKGCSPRGSAHPSSRLTEEKVRAIRRLLGQVSQGKLARIFGVSPSTIRSIGQRLSWKHVPASTRSA